MDRKGEKLGWTLGWLGGFLWILVFSIIWLFQGDLLNGFIGIILVIIAIKFILRYAPWKNPQTKFWKLMLPIYTIFMIGVIFMMIVLLTSWKELIYIQYGLWIIPCFTPLIIMGRRTWNQ